MLRLKMNYPGKRPQTVRVRSISRKSRDVSESVSESECESECECECE